MTEYKTGMVQMAMTNSHPCSARCKHAEQLQRNMHEIKKLPALLSKTSCEMLDELALSHKAMLVSTKKQFGQQSTAKDIEFSHTWTVLAIRCCTWTSCAPRSLGSTRRVRSASTSGWSAEAHALDGAAGQAARDDAARA